MIAAITGRPAWAWLAAPCAAMAVVSAIYPGLHPALLLAALPVWAATYMLDMWSTSRFGEENLRRDEANPVLRWALRYGMRRAFAVNAAVYAGALVTLPYALSLAGPIPWAPNVGIILSVMAAAHLWVAAGNMHQYKAMEAER